MIGAAKQEGSSEAAHRCFMKNVEGIFQQWKKYTIDLEKKDLHKYNNSA